MVDHFQNSREKEWKPIVENLKDLNVNCIRIYQLCNINDPEVTNGKQMKGSLPPPECGPHDKFMSALEDLGIYVIIPAISGK